MNPELIPDGWAHKPGEEKSQVVTGPFVITDLPAMPPPRRESRLGKLARTIAPPTRDEE